jgi:hypothetical protein
MQGGKFDEELRRMREIVDELREHSLLLGNESFAATNEREGGEIARQILSALLEKRVKIGSRPVRTRNARRNVPASAAAARRRAHFQADRGGAFADQLWGRLIQADIFVTV